MSTKVGISSNPDDPKHFYDYRALFAANLKDGGLGIDPETKELHFPSKFKKPGHPTLIKKVNGKLINTKTGKPATLEEKKKNDAIRKNVLESID